MIISELQICIPLVCVLLFNAFMINWSDTDSSNIWNPFRPAQTDLQRHVVRRGDRGLRDGDGHRHQGVQDVRHRVHKQGRNKYEGIWEGKTHIKVWKEWVGLIWNRKSLQTKPYSVLTSSYSWHISIPILCLVNGIDSGRVYPFIRNQCLLRGLTWLHAQETIVHTKSPSFEKFLHRSLHTYILRRRSSNIQKENIFTPWFPWHVTWHVSHVMRFLPLDSYFVPFHIFRRWNWFGRIRHMPKCQEIKTCCIFLDKGNRSEKSLNWNFHFSFYGISFSENNFSV